MLKYLIILLLFIHHSYCNDKPKDAYTNDPVELKPVYHKPNEYEGRSYDFWYENHPHPHVHGDKPKYDERHQHYKGYGDNYDFSNFITDAPTIKGSKVEQVVEKTEKDDISSDEAIIAEDKLTKPIEIPASAKNLEEPDYAVYDEIHETSTLSSTTDYPSNLQNPYQSTSSSSSSGLNQNLEGNTPSPFTDTHDTEYTNPPSPQPPPLSQSQIYQETPRNGVNENNYFKNPPGVQPDLFPEAKPTQTQNTGYESGPDPSLKADFFPESEIGGGHTVTLSPGPVEVEESGPRPCCPCCKEPPPVVADIGNSDAGCSEPVCGPPPIVGSPPNCCPQPPVPCCPRLPNCCIPQLPCCPRIEIPCCPVAPVCCQQTGCNSGCRSRSLTRIRTKRLGCIPCIGRKKREIFKEITHIRQKRLGCIPCLAREKRQTTQSNCQKCNHFQRHVVRRVKRTFSCSSCATHHERVKRQAVISDYYRNNQFGAYRNCEQCYQDILPRRPIMKRSSGFTDGQHSFLSRVKRAEDGYDPLFKCDAGCCDYNKCIKSKPLKLDTFKVPSDDDFKLGTLSESSFSESDLPKESELKALNIDSLVTNDEPKRYRKT